MKFNIISSLLPPEWKGMTIREKSMVFLVTLLWAPMILNFSTQVVAHLPVISGMAPLVKPGILSILFLSSFVPIKNRIKGVDLLFYISVGIVYVVSYFGFSGNANYLGENATVLFLVSLPFFYVGILSYNKGMLQWLYYASYLTVFLTVLYNMFYITQDDYKGEAEIIEDNLTASYALLIHVLMVLWHVFKSPGIYNVPVGVLGVFMILSFGGRGPVVCLAVYIFLYFFLFGQFKHPHTIRVLMVGLFLIFLSEYNYLVEWLFKLSEDLGLSTRVYSNIIQGTFVSDQSGRDVIAEKLMNEVSIFPHGLGGGYQFIGTYAHNLIIDLWIDFGTIIGSVLFLTLLYLIFKSYRKLKDSDYRVFLCILFVSGFVSMFLSGSYLSQSTAFYSLIGFCAIVGRKKLVVKC